MAKGRKKKIKTATGRKVTLPFPGAKMPYKSGGGRHTKR